MKVVGAAALRRSLGEWSEGIDDPTLVKAVIGAGILEAAFHLEEEDNPAAALAGWVLNSYGSHSWRSPERSLRIITAEEAAQAVGATPLRLQIDPAASAPLDLFTLTRFFTSAAGVTAHVQAELIAEPLWHWPLRVGFFSDPASADLRQAVTSPWAWPDLHQVTDPQQGCDLLLLPWSAAEADLAEQLPAVGPVAMVILLGKIDVPPAEVARVADRIALRFSAEGCHLANRPADANAWFRDLLEHLAHNRHLDQALAAANLGRSHYTNMSMALSSVNLEWVMGRFAFYLSQLGDSAFEVPPGLGALLPGFALAGPQPAGAVADYLDQARYEGRFTYQHETNEATGLAALVRAVEASPLPGIDELAFRNGHGAAPPEEEGEQVRIINGAVKLGDESHRLALAAGINYTLEVWIGVQSEESITLPGAAEFPTEELPTGPQRIDVAFTSLGNGKRIQTGQLILPERGDSDRVRFDLRYRRTGPIFGRLALAYQGKVLQTAVLSAEVVKARPSRLGRPRLQVETVIRAGFSPIEDEKSFDLAVIVNRDRTGRKTASTVRRGGVTLRSVDGLQDQIGRIKDTLTAVADDPDAFTSITTPASLELLFTLALLGESLHASFVTDHGVKDSFFKQGRVQIIAAAPDSYLPVELFYALPPPTVPELCQDWKEVVLAGTCPTCEAGYDDDTPVCLTGFWGVRYVVERHVHDPRYTGIGGDYRLNNEPITGRDLITPLESILWGISNNVLSQDRTSLGRLFNKRNFAATKAKAWSDFQEKVASLDPSLVFLLPHTDFKGALEASEIGGELELVSMVGKRMNEPREKHVMVVLLGCDTANTAIPFQGLVPRFRRAGAAVVVTTINTILGRHAVPVAKELLQLLRGQASDSERSMGDVLRDLRRQSLADGYPMVLSVAAFGDADWRLGS